MKRKLASSQNVEVSQLHLSYKLISGACAGLCYWVLTYPLDAIKGTYHNLNHHNNYYYYYY